MPRLEDAQAVLPWAQAKREWEGFTDFALRDNVLEVAVGLMYLPDLASLVVDFPLTTLQPRLRFQVRRHLLRRRHHPAAQLAPTFHRQELRRDLRRAPRRGAGPHAERLRDGKAGSRRWRPSDELRRLPEPGAELPRHRRLAVRDCARLRLGGVRQFDQEADKV